MGDERRGMTEVQTDICYVSVGACFTPVSSRVFICGTAVLTFETFTPVTSHVYTSGTAVLTFEMFTTVTSLYICGTAVLTFEMFIPVTSRAYITLHLCPLL